jgi:hypothetical protein
MNIKESALLVGIEQGSRRQTRGGTNTVGKYSTLTAAAALQRAVAAHLAEELDERRASGQAPTHKLSRLLPVACWLHEELAAVAEREGGQQP